MGKTVVLTKAMEALKAKGFSVGGMISKEVREGNTRVGFEIIDLTNDKQGCLANINQKSGPRIGTYRVNLADLENIGAKAITQAIEKCNVVAIDEIGPMELCSQKFKIAGKQALESEKPVLAIVHAKAHDPLITEAKQREDAELFTVTLGNRESLPQQLSKKILEIL